MGEGVSYTDLASELAAYVTNSGSPPDDVAARLTLRSARQTVPLLLELARAVYPNLPRTVREMGSFWYPLGAAAGLAECFTKHGSDKATGHDYHHLYAHILGERRYENLRIFEVGLGTNNVDVISNMGATGRPGASLRAFREYLPHARIYGADVDKRILFQEDRIKTYFVDQANLGTFAALERELGNEPFDLLIDDGLHSPDANLATLIFALKKLGSRGSFVVEDIRESSLPVWHLVSAILPAVYSSFVVRGQGGFLFVLQKVA